MDAKAGRRAISPLVYGLNFAPPELAEELRLPVNRWGGDSTDTYNWQLRTASEGANYYFTNYSDCWIPRFDYCSTGDNYSAAEDLIAQNLSIGTTTVLNLPMVGYVAKDQSRGGPGSCSFPVDVYPNQDDIEEFHGGCGNGEINGVPIDPDPTLAGLAIDDDYVEGWVDHLVDEYGTAAQGGVQIYELGNEPGLWHLTHRDFHEDPLTYDELWTRARSYALAVQNPDPTAATMGPSEWGYSHYLCSAADEPWYSCTRIHRSRRPRRHGVARVVPPTVPDPRGTDRRAAPRLPRPAPLPGRQRGGRPAVRPSDRRDPRAVGQALRGPVVGQPGRLDPRPQDRPHPTHEGVGEAELPGHQAGGERVQLRPGHHLRPAAAERAAGRRAGHLRPRGARPGDLLGGQDRGAGSQDTYIPADAFRIYRNYDGNGAQFGNVKVAATSTDQSALAVYAAQRGAKGVLTLVVVNKATEAVRGPLTLKRFRTDGPPPSTARPATG